MIILLPILDDWNCAGLLIERIDEFLPREGMETSILLVDDGSTHLWGDDFLAKPLKNIKNVEILRLRRNIGHQRAIAVGLPFIYQHRACDAVLIMDADGEDRPEDVPRLLEKFKESGCSRVIFAQRWRRSEGLVFAFFYRLYRVLNYLLTGIRVRVGNFSIIPFSALSALSVVPDLWNHYAAAVFRAQIRHDSVPTDRGRRISGKSKMNFVNLVTHGLSAMSVFSEIIGTRILISALILTVFLILLLSGIFLIRFFTELAIPGWATYSSGFIFIIAFQIFTVLGGFLFFILNSRNNLGFIPSRDHKYFIESVMKMDTRHE